jgi:SAM-dependent methyltransferase
MISRRFQFEPRNECACGHPLTAPCPRVDKAHPWGAITFLQCAHCGSWCQSPAIAEASLAEWFDSEDYRGSSNKPGAVYADYLADEPSRLVDARSRYERDIGPLLKPGARVLEIGCATGSLLSVIREQGHEVLGVDLSRTFVDFARTSHSLDVRLGDVRNLQLPPAHFDAVVAIGLVANLRSMSDHFARFRKLIRPGGLFVFTFADADSAWVRYLYRKRFWMFTPSGVTFLTTRGCLATLERSGFDTVYIRQDHQRPSFRKIARHSRMDAFALPLLTVLGLKDSSVPFPVPVPTVRLAVARPRTT